MRDENFDITVVNHNVNDSSNVVEKAYLLKYEGDTFIGVEEIESDDKNNPPDNRARLFHLDQMDKYDNMRLIVKVVYSNGETIEKEVYNNTN